MRRTQVRLTAAAAALVLLAGCSPDPLAPTTGPTNPTSAAPSSLSVRTIATIPMVQLPGGLDPVAGTGTSFLIEGETDTKPGQFTTDNGKTWKAAPAELVVRGEMLDISGVQFGNIIGYGGNYLGVRQEPAPDWSYSGFQRWNPVTGEVTSLDYDLDPPTPDDGDFEVVVYPIDYVGTHVLLNDSRIFDVSGDVALPVEPRLPDGLAATDVTWTGLTKDATYAVGTTTGKQVVIGPLGATGEPRTVAVPGLRAVDVSASTIHYLVGTAAALKVCRAEVTTPDEAHCVQVASGDFRAGRSIHLTTSDGADQIVQRSDDGQQGRLWFVRGDQTTLVATSIANWLWLPYRDAEAPTARVGSWEDRSLQVVHLADDGRALPLFAAQNVLASPGDLAVAPGRLVYQQEHPGSAGIPTRYVWQRTITPEGLGQEVMLTDRVVYGLAVSGDRTAVQWDRAYNNGEHRIVFYDGLGETGKFQGNTTTWAKTLSGPYVHLIDEHKPLAEQVVGIDGTVYATGQVLALFGSLVIEASAAEPAAGRTFTLRDLTRPEAATVPLPLPETATRVYRNGDWQLWGEWLVASYEVFTGNRQVVVNYRTGQVIELPEGEAIWELGDGWAVISGSGDESMVRDLTTGGEVSLGSPSALSIDGVQTLGWSADSATVAVLEGLAATPPRLLGAHRAGTFTVDGTTAWSPQFDLTRPLAAGTLEVADASGTVIAQIPTPASSTGSLRELAWYGRVGAGVVPPGSYTWTLRVSAADGGGEATSVDGLRPASGTLTIS